MARPEDSTSTHESGDHVYVGGRGSGSLADPGTMPPNLRRRRAVTLVLLTLVVPGSAQLAAGHRRLGRVGLRVWAGLLGCLVLIAVVGLVSRSTALSLASQGWFLLLVQWVLAAWAVLWGVLFVDAWRLGQPARLVIQTRRLLTGLTAAMLVVTSGGLIYGSASVASARGALQSVFSGDTEADASAGRYNVLMLGGDSGKGRVGLRPDSIQLASISEQSGKAVIFGFARDTENIDFRAGSVMQKLMPEGWNCGDECLLNGLYTWATDHADEFPAGTEDPGVLATSEAVEALTGLDVHYYVMVDMSGFTQMIDAVGGLDVNVATRTPIGGGSSPIVGWIEAGEQHLDGYDSLWYARSREGSSNYARMARQRCVMTAMVEQLDPATVLTRFRDITAASKGLLTTDLPQSELGHFAELALKTRSQKITSVNFVPPLMKPWDYEKDFISRTVDTTIAKSDGTAKKSAKKSAPSSAKKSAAAKKSATPDAPSGSTATPTTPADSAAAPDDGGAATEDLGVECSAG